MSLRVGVGGLALPVCFFFFLPQCVFPPCFVFFTTPPRPVMVDGVYLFILITMVSTSPSFPRLSAGRAQDLGLLGVNIEINFCSSSDVGHARVDEGRLAVTRRSSGFFCLYMLGSSCFFCCHFLFPTRFLFGSHVSFHFTVSFPSTDIWFRLSRQQLRCEEFIVLNVVITSMLSRLW